MLLLELWKITSPQTPGEGSFRDNLTIYIYIFHHGRNYQNSRGHADCFAGFCMSLPEVPCEKWAGDHTMVKTCTKTGVSVGSDVGRVIDKHSVHKMFPTNHSL